MIFLLGALDYVTGWELSLFTFYAVPLLYLLWNDQQRAAGAVTVLCLVVWIGANFNDNPYRTWWGFAMAAASRMIYFVLVVIAGVMFKQKRDADQARMEAMERTRDLEQGILRISEREQQRIGQDLHDGLCQQLAAIGCAARSLADDLAGKSVPEAREAREIEELLREAVRQTRDLAAGMFPPTMGGNGLAAALAVLASSTAKLTSSRIHFDSRGDPEVPDPNAAMHLFRIAQEALNNALRHGQAQNIDLTLGQEGAVITLTVDDDGCGLSDNAKEFPAGGLGLRTMHHRAELLKSTLRVRPRPEGGTRVEVSLRTDTKPVESTPP